jgi:hypothetical protein
MKVIKDFVIRSVTPHESHSEWMRGGERVYLFPRHRGQVRVSAGECTELLEVGHTRTQMKEMCMGSYWSVVWPDTEKGDVGCSVSIAGDSISKSHSSSSSFFGMFVYQCLSVNFLLGPTRAVISFGCNILGSQHHRACSALEGQG